MHDLTVASLGFIAGMSVLVAAIVLADAIKRGDK
jgi:hypothetical protein